MKVELSTVKEICRRFSRTTQRIYFGILPYRKAYGSPEWRFVILASPDGQNDYIIHTNYISIAIGLSVRTRVLQSNLQSTDTLIGYFECWEKGRLISRTELHKEIKHDVSILFSSRLLSVQCRQVLSVSRGNMYCP